MDNENVNKTTNEFFCLKMQLLHGNPLKFGELIVKASGHFHRCILLLPTWKHCASTLPERCLQCICIGSLSLLLGYKGILQDHIVYPLALSILLISVVFSACTTRKLKPLIYMGDQRSFMGQINHHPTTTYVVPASLWCPAWQLPSSFQNLKEALGVGSSSQPRSRAIRLGVAITSCWLYTCWFGSRANWHHPVLHPHEKGQKILKYLHSRESSWASVLCYQKAVRPDPFRPSLSSPALAILMSNPLAPR